jgi:hypothetical protein
VGAAAFLINAGRDPQKHKDTNTEAIAIFVNREAFILISFNPRNVWRKQSTCSHFAPGIS